MLTLKRPRSDRLILWVLAVPMALLAFTTIYPIFFTLNIAFKTRREFIMDRFAFTLQPTMENFQQAWELASIQTFFFNSLIVTVGAVILLTIVASMAGYGFAMMQFRGRRLLFFVILSGMMVPIQVILVPFAQLISSLGLTNQYHGLILAYTAFRVPFSVYLMTTFYSGIPEEIIEAAKLDGASLWQTFTSIMLPLGKPAIMTLAILNSLIFWNDILISLIVMQDRKMRTLMVGIAALRGEHTVNIPLLAAGIILAAAPVIVVFLVFQANITKGITVGAVKA